MVKDNDIVGIDLEEKGVTQTDGVKMYGSFNQYGKKGSPSEQYSLPYDEYLKWHFRYPDHLKDEVIESMLDEKGIKWTDEMSRDEAVNILLDNYSLGEIARRASIGISCWRYQREFNVEQTDIKRLERLGILKVVGYLQQYGTNYHLMFNIPIYDIEQFNEMTKDEIDRLIKLFPPNTRKSSVKRILETGQTYARPDQHSEKRLASQKKAAKKDREFILDVYIEKQDGKKTKKKLKSFLKEHSIPNDASLKDINEALEQNGYKALYLTGLIKQRKERIDR